MQPIRYYNDWSTGNQLQFVSLDSQNGPFYTVVFSVAWLLHDSEAGGDLILMQTSPLLLCKLSRSSTAFEKENQRGLYEGKVTSSLACIRMPGNLAHNSV